jgi:arylsulfatase A-like enzyme
MGRQHPLKNWKREVHHSGMADPMIGHWPGRHPGLSSTSSTSRFFRSPVKS